MKQSILILIASLLINRCHADGLERASGGRAAAMGGTSACEQSVWALHNNPAGLATLHGWHGGLYYENQWLLKEAAFKSGGLAKSFTDIGCFGMAVRQYGWSQFSENLFSVAYARDFGPYLQMGLRADWIWLHFSADYPDRNAPGFELGIQSQVTDRLRLGATLFNPLNTKLKTLNEDTLPIVMKLGLAYRFTEDFTGQLELEKSSLSSGVRIGGGLEYLLFERFSLRAGAQHRPDILSFGVGYALNRLQVDVAAQMHQALGASLQIGITGQW